MLLTENEVQASIEQARTAFPRFDSWQYNNEENVEYTGFSLWGESEIVDDDESQVPALPRTYFITFDTYQKAVAQEAVPNPLWLLARVLS